MNVNTRMSPTISNIRGLNQLKFPLDVGIEQPVVVKSVRALLPARQIRYLVSVNYMALRPQLVYVTYFGIYGCQ